MKIKRVLICLGIILLVIGVVVFFSMSQKIKKLAKQDFSMINIGSLSDGIYQGSASALLVTARVEVTVNAGHILEVKLLEHSHGPGYGAEALCDNIVKTNSPDVDGISGATASSLVIKTAVLEALKSKLAP